MMNYINLSSTIVEVITMRDFVLWCLIIVSCYPYGGGLQIVAIQLGGWQDFSPKVLSMHLSDS